MQRAKHLDRLNRDRPGGHGFSALSDGTFYCAPGRRFAKKLDKKKARHQSSKLTAQALREYEEDYQYWHEQHMNAWDDWDDWDDWEVYEWHNNNNSSRDLSWENDPYWRKEAKFNAHYNDRNDNYFYY